MTPITNNSEVQASALIEGGEETSPVSVLAEADDPAMHSAGILIQDDLTSKGQDTKSRDIAQEIGRLLQEVLNQLRQTTSPPGQTSTTSKPGDESDGDASETSSKVAQFHDEKPMIPKVRRVDFEHFKNHFDEDDGRYIIDALVAGSKLAQQIREERLKRQKRGLGTSSTPQPEFSASPVVQGDGTIRRIRIRSRSILYYLSKLADAPAELDGTITFVYPFAPLLYLQEDMRRILNLLEAKWTPSTRASSHAGIEASNLEHDDDLPSEFHKDTIEKSTETGQYDSGSAITITLDSEFDTPFTLEEFRSYVAFVDKDLSHLADKYRDTSHSSITFEDLWLLFKPGEYVAATIGPKTLLQRRNPPVRKFCPFQTFGKPD